MSKSVAFAAALVLFFSATAFSLAAESSTSVTCNDGTKLPTAKDACSNHGGVKNPKSTSTPIDTRKGLSPRNKATTTKNKTHANSASKTTRKKATSKTTRNPTARCNDGAQYFSTERRGACASHGGVKTWY